MNLSVQEQSGQAVDRARLVDACRREQSRRPARHLLHVFPSFGLGGVPIRISGIVNHFGRRYRHTFVALDSQLDCRVRIEPGIDAEFRAVEPSSYGLLSNLALFRRLTRRISPNLLLTYNWGAAEWALANTLAPICPNIHFESGFGPEEADGRIARRVWFRRAALARSARLVVPSHALVDIATKDWKLSHKLVHIPNGVDLNRFARAQPEPAGGLAPAGAGEVIIGTLAPLRREKNIERLLRAFAALEAHDDVRLAVVGDGVERPALKRLAESLGLDDRVVFTGHLEAVEHVLPCFDVFALTSDTEQMPNSLIQAMAAARPVAAVDVGDVKHVLSEPNRDLVVDKGDKAGLVKALDRLARDPSLRQRLGQANQERVRACFTQDRMFDAYDALLSDVLS